MTLTREAIGERLKEARRSVQLSQEAAAAAIGLDRTALVKLEKGTRAVTGVELHELALLYRRDVAEFLDDKLLQEDPFTTIGRIEGNAPVEWDGPVERNVMLLKEAVRLRELLGDRVCTYPPFYKLPSPRSYKEAVEQGKEIAVLERERLKLGNGPISNVADLLTSQGIWAAEVPFPEDVSGLFIAHQKYGLAIFINQAHYPVRKRFSYAHEYAHALMDRNRKEPDPTSKKNSSQYVERRANAFASEFLIPAAGVYETLERMQKGRPSHAPSWIWDAATDEAVHHEIRHNGIADQIGAHDVALIAHEYAVSYDAAAIRLRDINIVGRSQLETLLQDKDKGKRFIDVLRSFDSESQVVEKRSEQPHLIRQLIVLAIEAFRREKISSGRFREICNLAKIPYEDLMPVAMAGIQER